MNDPWDLTSFWPFKNQVDITCREDSNPTSVVLLITDSFSSIVAKFETMSSKREFYPLPHPAHHFSQMIIWKVNGQAQKNRMSSKRPKAKKGFCCSNFFSNANTQMRIVQKIAFYCKSDMVSRSHYYDFSEEKVRNRFALLEGCYFNTQ